MFGGSPLAGPTRGVRSGGARRRRGAPCSVGLTCSCEFPAERRHLLRPARPTDLQSQHHCASPLQNPDCGPPGGLSLCL